MEKPNRKPGKPYDGILTMIQNSTLTNEELKQLEQAVHNMITYKFEYEGEVFTLHSKPPIDDRKLDKKSAFKELVAPYLESRSLTHISNARDLANFIELSIENDIIVLGAVLKIAFKRVVELSEPFIQALRSKQGRKTIMRYIDDHSYELKMGAKKFIKYMKERDYDLVAEGGMKVVLIVLRLIIALS